MIRYSNKFINPNIAGDEDDYWRKTFKNRLAVKNKAFLNLSDVQLRAMEDKLGSRGLTLKQVCQDDEDSLDFERLFQDAQLDIQFRQIVRKAMIKSGLGTVDEQCEFIEWAIGEDYKELEYQFWPARLASRAGLMASQNTSVYSAISEAVRAFKSRIIRVGYGG